jgi:hypothetical protein
VHSLNITRTESPQLHANSNLENIKLEMATQTQSQPGEQQVTNVKVRVAGRLS